MWWLVEKMPEEKYSLDYKYLFTYCFGDRMGFMDDKTYSWLQALYIGLYSGDVGAFEALVKVWGADVYCMGNGVGVVKGEGMCLVKIGD